MLHLSILLRWKCQNDDVIEYSIMKNRFPLSLLNLYVHTPQARFTVVGSVCKGMC